MRPPWIGPRAVEHFIFAGGVTTPTEHPLLGATTGHNRNPYRIFQANS